MLHLSKVSDNALEQNYAELYDKVPIARTVKDCSATS